MLNPNNNQSWEVVFPELPTNLDMIKSLPEAGLKEPHYAAALLIPALCLWPTDQSMALGMLNFLGGPKELTPRTIQFMNDRFRDKAYLPFSYFQGSTPENDYRPTMPFTVRISAVPTSFDEPGYAKLYLKSSGADSPRPVQLRFKESTGQWFLWDQMLLSEIRVPGSKDPWA